MATQFTTRVQGKKRSVDVFTALGRATTANQREIIMSELVMRAAHAVKVFDEMEHAMKSPENDPELEISLFASMKMQIDGLRFFVEAMTATQERELPFIPIVAVETGEGDSA